MGLTKEGAGVWWKELLNNRSKESASWSVGELITRLPCRLRGDKALALQAVQIDGAAFFAFDPPIRGDRKAVLAAVAENGDILQRLGDKFRADREIVMKAVTNNGSALEFAASHLRTDPELLRPALQQTKVQSQTQSPPSLSSTVLATEGFEAYLSTLYTDDGTTYARH